MYKFSQRSVEANLKETKNKNKSCEKKNLQTVTYFFLFDELFQSEIKTDFPSSVFISFPQI